MMKLTVLFLLLGFGIAGNVFAAEPLTLSTALATAFQQNPEVAAMKARVEAEQAMVGAQYAPANPKIGFMRENNLNFMEQQMGPMNSWTVSQEILFPSKYFVKASGQRAMASGAEQEYLGRRLEVRRQVLSNYYGLYSVEKILALMQAQRETLREVARIAESRYATGTVSQQDQMKAHTEQTRLESDILMVTQERDSMRAMLNALMNHEPSAEITLSSESLPVPALKVPSDKIETLVAEKSLDVKQAKAQLEGAQSGRTLAKYGYAPDFMLSYRKAYANAPDNAYSFSVEATIPLWFFLGQKNEVAAAGARVQAAEKQLEQTKRDRSARSTALSARAKSLQRVLHIYDTSLVPQATTTLETSRAAYRAGKTTFIELLDSERSLYEVRIAYYRTLTQYVEAVSELEAVAGTSLSSLPMGDGV